MDTWTTGLLFYEEILSLTQMLTAQVAPVSCFLTRFLSQRRRGSVFIVPCSEVRTSLYTVSVPFATGAVAQSERHQSDDIFMKTLKNINIFVGHHLCRGRPV